jgi:hypothetical protein
MTDKQLVAKCLRQTALKKKRMSGPCTIAEREAIRVALATGNY